MSFKILLLIGCVACAETTPKVVLDKPQTAKTAAITTDTLGKSLFISTDGGSTWQADNGNLPNGIQTSFLVKWGNEIVLATDNKGLFLSKNGRTEWLQIGATLPNVKITAVFADATEIAVGVYNAGFFSSRDSGKTWTAMNQGLDDLSVRSIQKIEGNWLIGTNTGVFKQQTGMGFWQKTFAEGQVKNLLQTKDVIIGGTNKGIILSKDKGKTWTWVLKPDAVYNMSLDNGRIFALNVSKEVFISDNIGQTWRQMPYAPPSKSYVHELVRVGNAHIMTNYDGVLRSENEGMTWKMVHPTNSSYMFFDFLVFGNTVYGGIRGLRK